MLSDTFLTAIDAYFKSQIGGSGDIDVASAPILIRGRGLGGLITNAIKFASPVLLKLLHSLAPAAKHIGKEAVKEIGKAGLETLGDAVRGEPIKKAVRKRARKAAENVVQATAEVIKPKKKRKVKDILS